jgi:integrase
MRIQEPFNTSTRLFQRCSQKFNLEAGVLVNSSGQNENVLPVLGALVGDARERGLVARNIVRDLRSRRHRGKEMQAESRQKGKLKVGLDIPSPGEIRAIVAHLQGRWRPFLLTATFTGL